MRDEIFSYFAKSRIKFHQIIQIQNQIHTYKSQNSHDSNSWFLVYLFLSLSLYPSISHAGNTINVARNAYDSQIEIITPTTATTAMMTKITPPLAMPQRLKDVVTDGHQQYGTKTAVVPINMETKPMDHHQLSLPLVAHGQRTISDGEPIPRSPIKVDIRVQFLPKQSSYKPKTKKKKRDENICSNSDDDGGDDDYDMDGNSKNN